jgi:16S rRNA (guanine527-N7)-methyltransferase
MSAAAQRRLRELDSGVSRETLGRLEAMVEVLLHWQKAINLVGRATLDDVWTRHILDSAQLLPLIPEGTRT